jgi:hypothetical protein
MFLVGIDRVVIDAASDGRPDMMAGAFSFAGLALFLYLRERNLDLAIFAGHCLVAAGIVSHPVAMNGFFGVIFLSLYLDRGRLRWRHLFLTGLPYLLAIAGWGLFILQDRADFWPQFSVALRSRGSGFFAPWKAVLDEFSLRYLRFYLPPYAQRAGRLRVLIPLLYFAAAFGGWFVPQIRQSPGRRALLLLAAIYFVVMTFTEGLKSYYYMIHIVPVLACTLAMAIAWGWQRSTLWRCPSAAILTVFVILQIGWTVALIRRNDYRNTYLPAIAFLKEHAPQPDIVNGTTELGFELGFYNKDLIEDAAFGYYTKKLADYIVIDEDRAFGQSMQSYKKYAPWLYTYETDLLDHQYHLVYDRQVYKIYAKKP